MNMNARQPLEKYTEYKQRQQRERDAAKIPTIRVIKDGNIRIVGDTRYIVSTKGPWVRLVPPPFSEE